jgi:hypothetical protein
MNKGAIVACGDPDSVQRSDLLSEVFAIDLTVGTRLASKNRASCRRDGSPRDRACSVRMESSSRGAKRRGDPENVGAPHVLWIAHMGTFSSRSCLRWRCVLWRLAADPRFEPVCAIWRLRRINLTYGRRAVRLHLDSAFGGEGSGGGTILRIGVLTAMQSIGRRPGSAEADQASADGKECGRPEFRRRLSWRRPR